MSQSEVCSYLAFCGSNILLAEFMFLQLPFCSKFC